MKAHTKQLQQSNAAAMVVRTGRKERAWLAPAVMFATLAAVHLSTLMRVQEPFVDEGWNASRAWALLNTGRAFSTMDAGVFDKYDGYWTYFPWLGAAIHSVFVGTLGPTLFSMRFASLAFGLCLLIAVYIIAGRLYGSRAGLLAIVLLSLSYSFFFSARMARHDIIVAAMGFGAIALYVTDAANKARGQNSDFRLQTSELIRSVLSGLLVGLTLDVHMNGLIFGFVIAALYLLDYKWRVVRSLRFWGFVLGALIGVAFFVAMHILPYPETYFTLAGLGNKASRTPPLLTADPGVLLASFTDAILLLMMMLGALVILAGAALVFLLRRRSASDTKLLVIFGVLFLAFVCIIRVKFAPYGILLAPAACLLAAAFLDRLFGESWTRSRLVYVRNVLAATVVVAAAVPNLQGLLTDYTAEYEAALSQVRTSVPKGSTAIGPQTWWFALPEERYLSWEQLVYWQRDKPGSTLEDAFSALGPEYLIVDRWMDGFIREDRSKLPQNLGDLYIPKAEIDGFLGDHGQLVGELKTNTFGNLRIYRLR